MPERARPDAAAAGAEASPARAGAPLVPVRGAWVIGVWSLAPDRSSSAPPPPDDRAAVAAPLIPVYPRGPAVPTSLP